MNKDRLAAFTDAILAIIMTILVLELEKPTEASWTAVWALRQSFVSYIISFFWLGAMWVNLHSQWQRIKRIDIAIKVIGFGISMMICPPLTLAFVILAGILPSIVAHKNQKKV